MRLNAYSLATLIFDVSLITILLLAATRVMLSERRINDTTAAPRPRVWQIVSLIGSGILALRILVPIAGNLGIEYSALTLTVVLLLYPSTRLWHISRRTLTIVLSALAISINLGSVLLVVWLTRNSSANSWLIACATVFGINAGIAIPALYFSYLSSEKQ